MRILFCNYEYPPLGGGGGVVNAYLAEELAKKHDVTVLTSQCFTLEEETIENGVRVLRVPVYFRKQEAVATLPSMFSYIPMGIKGGKQLLRRENFDIINTHFVLPSGPVGDSLSKFRKTPNVLSVHGGDLYDPSKFTSPHRHFLLRVWINKLLRKADVVVGQSQNTLDNVTTYYAPEIKGDLIPLGIKRPPPGKAQRSKYGFKKDEILLVTVGRLKPRKALPQLIEIVARLKKENIRLVIVGKGPEEQSLRDAAATYDCGDKISLMGNVEELEKFKILRMSDIYVSTSQHEGFGLVFVEGMACGLPVLCYDHGGQSDFLEGTVTGFLPRLNDRSDFEAKLLYLLKNRMAREKMGKENLLRAEKLFIDRCSELYVKCFEKTIEKHARNNRLI